MSRDDVYLKTIIYLPTFPFKGSSNSHPIWWDNHLCSMKAHNLMEIQFHKMGSIVCLVAWNQMSHNLKSVHIDKNRIHTFFSLGNPKAKSMEIFTKVHSRTKWINMESNATKNYSWLVLHFHVILTWREKF